jgi:hypothetical protein
MSSIDGIKRHDAGELTAGTADHRLLVTARDFRSLQVGLIGRRASDTVTAVNKPNRRASWRRLEQLYAMDPTAGAWIHYDPLDIVPLVEPSKPPSSVYLPSRSPANQAEPPCPI